MRWAAKRNWSWPVTLPRAVEFRSAMEQLGIVDPDERIYFVRKHKLPVFIAPKPLVGTEHTDVFVQLYPYAYHSSLGDKEVLELHTGKQTLCLDAASYERLLEEYGPKTKSAYVARIAELDGQERIAEPHLNAALAMWGYAQDSALYIFGDRAADPLELRVLALLDQGPLSATDLSRAFSGHMPNERLQPILQQLEAQRRIFITKQKNGGRPKLILALHGVGDESAISAPRFRTH